MASGTYIRFPQAVGSGGGSVTAITSLPNPTPAVIATAPTQVSVTSAATKVFAKTTGIQSVTVQNQGTVAVTIGQTSAVTAGGLGIVLNACTTTGDGTGGSFTFASYCGDIYCITASATVNVGVQATAAL